MGRVNLGIEKGLSIFAENGDIRIMLLQGTAAPDGVSGDQGAAPIGSLYARSGTGELYQKTANGGAPGDWSAFQAATIGNWRPERVDAHTGQVLGAGNTDPTTWSDNDDGTDDTSFTIGHYVLDGNCDLWEITGISSPNLTLAAAATAPVADDMFAVKFNMPDPAGQENQAIIVYDGTQCVKVADVDFGSATAINLVAPYTPASGDPIAGDSVQAAIEKLDGNNDDQDTLLGTAQGDVDLGTIGGTGDVVADNSTVKGAIESLDTELTDTRQNVDDLITLSGVAENATDQGVMDQGDILSDNATENALFKEVDAELTRQRGKTSASAVTSLTVLDSVDVNVVAACDWLVTVEDVATQKSAHFRVFAGHDGSSDGVTDATDTDDTVGKLIKIGGNFDYDVTVDLNGTGASQVMRLNINSAEVSGVNVFAKRTEILF